MICVTCNLPLGQCACPDRDASLKELAMDTEVPVAFKWCRTCDKHYARCTCEQPDFYLLCAGQELDPSNLRNVLGHRMAVDLTRR